MSRPDRDGAEERLDAVAATLDREQAGGDGFVVDAARCTRTVHTDPRRVRQILLNLLSNATHFGALEPIVMRCADTDSGVTVEIIDRGPAIAAEDISRIFEEFVQLDGRGGEGTGLGLAISRRLADLLGGRLEVDSRLGQGSTFRIVPPRTVRGTYVVSVAPEDGAAPQTDRGPYMGRLRKQVAGSWLWTTDMISSELPLPRSGMKGLGSAMLACPAGLRNCGRSPNGRRSPSTGRLPSPSHPPRTRSWRSSSARTSPRISTRWWPF